MKLNGYKLKSQPTEYFAYKVDGINSYSDLKKNVEFDKKIATFYRGEIITPEKIVGLSEKQVDKEILPWGVSRDLFKQALKRKITEIGLVEASNDRYIFPNGSSMPPIKIGEVYINYGFSICVDSIWEDTFFFIDPKRVVTSDGEKFDALFHKENSQLLLKNTLAYKEFVKVTEEVSLVLGQNFSIETSTGTYSLALENNIPDNDIKSTGSEPMVSFGLGKSHSFPAAGLKRFGPWDYNSSEDRPKEIKFGIIGPGFSLPLLREIYKGQTSSTYGFPGFESVYRTKLIHNGDKAKVELSENEISQCQNKDDISTLFREKARQIRADSDVAIIELPESATKINFVNLRDYLKVIFWEERLPTKIILENTTKKNETLVVDNLALGLYVSAGGRPWVLEEPSENSVFVGVSFGMSQDKKKLIGIFEIFDGYGLSLSTEIRELTEFNYEIDERDYHLTKNQLSELIKQVIWTYSEKYDGNHPERVIVHKTSYFNEEESKVIEELNDFAVDLAFVYIDCDGGGIHLLSDSGSLLPKRRNYFKTKENKAILYTKGVDEQGRALDPFLPKPLTLELQKTSPNSQYDIEKTCQDIIKLTKLNWNSVVSYEREPVTISHSRKIVRLLRVGLSLNNAPSDLKYFL